MSLCWSRFLSREQITEKLHRSKQKRRMPTSRFKDLTLLFWNLLNPGAEFANDIVYQVGGSAVRSERLAKFFTDEGILIQKS